ncbi:hypothetical protein Q9R38_03455 [Priestia aryabhattai]|uniref:hypothetical protein n=1 Tax=Priestia aryabhattai TaxID=412384 RepID=UPI002881A6B2|nr:hypothetical protein [Priestia aryabhattai]MDT0145551.1 hypothetical protein [Priestia aryabhattai]MDT0151293.1 hypothetical protein [Priestia aryabhattai]
MIGEQGEDSCRKSGTEETHRPPAEIDSTSSLIQFIHLYIGLISVCLNLSTLYQH